MAKPSTPVKPKRVFTDGDVRAQLATEAGLYLAKHYGSEDKPVPEGYVRDPRALEQFDQWKNTRAKEIAQSMGVTLPGVFIIEVTMAEQAKVPAVEKEKPTEQKPAKEAERKFKVISYTKEQCPGIGSGTLGDEGRNFREGTIAHDLFKLWLRRGEQALTVEQQVEELHKAHPDHSKESLATSIRVKITAMPKKRGFNLGRDEKGRYSIFTEGRSKARILTPEQEAAKKAKEEAAKKAKEEKAAAKAKAKTEKEEAAKAAKAKAEQEKEAAAKAKAEEGAKAAKGAVPPVKVVSGGKPQAVATK